MEFRILFQDEFFVAIEKPAGILVHRTGISADRIFVLQELRNQLGRHVYPVHRLDRGTAGVLLFAFDSAGAKALQATLESEQTTKTYLAILRGWIPDSGLIDTPLEKDGTGELQTAHTSYRRLATSGIADACRPVSHGTLFLGSDQIAYGTHAPNQATFCACSSSGLERFQARRPASQPCLGTALRDDDHAVVCLANGFGASLYR
ncbi:MAG: hypothetical protein IPP17_21405 [Bacteroidetes bacterium]|nr:hypothetical protein [Bacteroidota bacterium]